MQIQLPYLLFLGDAADPLAAKTALGVAHWRPEICVGQMRLPGCRADAGLPERTLEQAAAAGARTVLVGVANRGGRMAPAWEPVLLRALDLGMDLANGLHVRLTSLPAVRERAERLGRKLWDVRHPDREFPVGTGARRPGKRLLTVGTDCSVGKMYAALALEREMRRRGLRVDFRATGQTGILIAGAGISVDAVVSDFVAGAVEVLAPANEVDHWDVIEGQASVLHPSYAGVTVALVHGAQPDAMVLCHDPTRPHMRALPHFPLPRLQDCIAAHEQVARLTNPAARVVGISLNTSSLDAERAAGVLHATEAELGLPTVDAVRTGVARIVDRLVGI